MNVGTRVSKGGRRGRISHRGGQSTADVRWENGELTLELVERLVEVEAGPGPLDAEAAVLAERDRMTASSKTWGVLDEVAAERQRQDERWGQQDHPDHPRGEAWAALGRLLEAQARATLRTTGGLSWSAVMAEEIGEAWNALDGADLRAELVQVAAVAVAWIEAIDRRGGR